jgi:hypothetical protein
MLIVIGVLFLLNNLFPGEFSFGRMWPIILIVIGLVKVFEYFRGPVAPAGRRTDGYRSDPGATDEPPLNTRTALNTPDLASPRTGEGVDKKEGM